MAAQLRRLHDQPAAARPARRQGLGRLRVRRQAAAARARRPGPAARAAPVLLEVGQVGDRPRPDGAATSAASGRSSATTTTVTRGASSGTRATELAGRDRHGDQGRDRDRPHADPRRPRLARPPAPASTSPSSSPPRTATPPSATTRSPAPPEARTGSSSPCSAWPTARCRRTWPASPSRATSSRCAARSAAGSPGTPADPRPLLLLAGGSGVVPLMSMIRTHAQASSQVPVRLIYSARTPADVIYADELSERVRVSPLTVTYLYTRGGRTGRGARRPHRRRRHRRVGRSRRRGPRRSSSAAPPASSRRPRPPGRGRPPRRHVKTERFGPTGPAIPPRLRPSSARTCSSRPAIRPAASRPSASARTGPVTGRALQVRGHAVLVVRCR